MSRISKDDMESSFTFCEDNPGEVLAFSNVPSMINKIEKLGVKPERVSGHGRFYTLGKDIVVEIKRKGRGPAVKVVAFKPLSKLPLQPEEMETHFNLVETEPNIIQVYSESKKMIAKLDKLGCEETRLEGPGKHYRFNEQFDLVIRPSAKPKREISDEKRAELTERLKKARAAKQN